MNCPYCNSNEHKVVDKRNRKKDFIWRRRKCLDCGGKFSTKEIVYVVNHRNAK